jgi:protein-S-isoprenylcysteine O-methyltransferase Ste14
MVASVALGNLARSQGDLSGEEKANNSIQAFWAPFLLLHLGGPDTITAYSIEDNELWLRHLLGLVVQVGVAFYVFSRSWPSGILAFIAIPMFIVGIVKYAERTWVLWSSCSKSLKNSNLFDFWRSYHLKRIKEIGVRALQGNYLRQAYIFSYISRSMMQDLVPSLVDLMLSQLLMSKYSAGGAFKVVEVELGLIYDMLYTKAPLIYSRAGIILRSISFLLTFTAFITFQVKIERHAYSTIDFTITYLLFVAAFFLEFYAFLCLVFSDWTMIWLTDEGRNALTSALYSLIRKLTRSERWSRSIAQYNLISSSIESKPPKCFEFLGIDEMMRQMNVNRKDMNGGLQDFIFGHLQKNSMKIKENFNFIDKNFRRTIIGQRGDGVLEREGLLQDLKWSTTEVEFSRSILVWHLATEICYCVDKDANNVSSEYKTSRCLSEYMMYLLVMRPDTLSQGIGDEGYLHSLRDLDSIISKEEAPTKSPAATSREEVVDAILFYYESYVIDDIRFQFRWKETKSAVAGGDRLAKQLRLLGFKKRWEIIEEVWMEMLAYAAAHCPWKEHAQQLRRGGELLTHVCFLMLHLGLSEQYEYNSFKDYNSLNDYIRGHDLVLPWVSLPKIFLEYISSIDYHVLIFVSEKTME